MSITLMLILINLIFNITEAKSDVERYFVYETNSEVNAINLNGNFNVFVNVLNGGLTNENINTADGYRLYEVLGVLPAAGTLGRTVFYTPEKTLNFDTGSEWYSAITLLRPPVQGDIVYYNGTNWVVLTTGTKGKSLTTGGATANPSWEGMAAQGDIEYHNGTTRTALGAGTSGQFLKTQGAGANPAWTSTFPIGINVFSSSGTWDWSDAGSPKTVYVKVWGAGGGGGSAGYGGGGGSGAYAEGLVAVTADVTITVGIGGTGGTAGSNDAAAGGLSSFGTNIVAGGGVGALGTNGGIAGTAPTGTLTITGMVGGDVISATVSGSGGGAPMGGSGGTMQNEAAGNAGGIPGGGGGGGENTTNNVAGGAGANGLVMVYY